MQAFWQCKFYTDIHEGCVKTKGHQKTVRLSTTTISSTVAIHE